MLKNGGSTKKLGIHATTQGYLARGKELQPGAVVTQMPDSLEGAEISVCGVKGFLVDERRHFRLPDGTEATVDCAKVAVLDITDSPVHIHGETIETYHIISGTGRMVLGEEIVDVSPGTYIVIPPAVPHGLSSNDPNAPVRVLMTFSPGMAPVSRQQFRDEQIIHRSAKAFITSRDEKMG